MTVNDAVKRIKDRSHRGNVDITTDSITAQILRALSDALRELNRRVPKRKLWKEGSLSVVQGTVRYSLASDVQEPIVFRYTVSGTLYLPVKVESDREWFENIFDPDAAQDDPDFYREIGPDSSGNKQIEFYPTPKQALTVSYEYYKSPATELTTSDLTSQIPNLPDELHDAAWKGGLYHFLKGFDDAGQAIAQSDYERAKLELDSADEQDQDLDLQLRFGKSDNKLRSESGIRII